ncbi:MAG: hypothetical protein FJW31_03910 [Acidobacteria bacterium]|nr:hypothetical protein [Acidobacteriota bacterium]
MVAELVQPRATRQAPQSKFDRLIAPGVITPPSEGGDPLERCPNIRLPRGAAARLIDADREEK